MAGNSANEDFGNALAAMAKAMAKVGADMKSLNREFAETTGFAKDLAGLLGQIAKTSNDLPRGVKTTKDLMSAMLKDEKLFEKIQKQSFNMQQDELKKYWQKKIIAARKMSGLGWDQIKQTKQYKYLQSLMLTLEEKKSKQLEKQFSDLKDQAGTLDKQKDKILDIKGMWEKVGDGIRHPTNAINGFVSVLSKGLSKGINLLGGLTSAFGLLGAAIGGGLLGGLMLAIAAFTQMWNFLDKKVLPATAQFNKQIGNMGSSTANLKGEMVSAGVQFEMLGKSFEEGAADVRSFAEGMMLVGRSKKELHGIVQTGLKLTEVVGLSAEQSGKLALFWEKSEGSLDGLNKSMDEASKVAHKYQVPVNQIRRDLGDDLNLLARFGTRNRQVMLESAGRARTYGMSIKDINGSFGEQMDTFDKTSDIAAKLNSVFGTHINSYKLMLETDPVKRMEMLRKELLKQGKSWDKLNVFEQNVIASTLGVSKEQAALGLSSDSVRKKLQKQADEQARQNKINQDWDKGLGNVKQTLLALGPKLDMILRSTADFISELFGFGPAGKNVVSTADAVGRALDGINAGIQSATRNINVYKDTWDSIFQPIDSKRADQMIDLINKKNKTAEDLLELQKGVQNKDVQEIMMRRLQTYEGKSQLQAQNLISKYSNTFSQSKMEALTKKEEEKGQLSAGAGKFSSFKNDALITKTGQVIGFNPQDNILATKSPVKQTSQGAVAVAGKGSGGGDITIMPAPIYLDGTKIAEAIFRATRR